MIQHKSRCIRSALTRKKQRIDKMLGLETSVSKVNTRMDLIESQIKDAKSQSNADIAELSKPKQDISVSGLFNEKK